MCPNIGPHLGPIDNRDTLWTHRYPSVIRVYVVVAKFKFGGILRAQILSVRVQTLKGQPPLARIARHYIRLDKKITRPKLWTRLPMNQKHSLRIGHIPPKTDFDRMLKIMPDE